MSRKEGLISAFPSESVSHSRSGSRGEEAAVLHPDRALQLQDGAERTGAGDGVHRRRAVSEIICRFSFSWAREPTCSSVIVTPCNRALFESSPTPEISWSKVSSDLPSERRSFLHFQKTLRIVNVFESDAGDYRCTAKNKLGSVHHTIHVMVNGASAIWTPRASSLNFKGPACKLKRDIPT